MWLRPFPGISVSVTPLLGMTTPISWYFRSGYARFWVWTRLFPGISGLATPLFGYSWHGYASFEKSRYSNASFIVFRTATKQCRATLLGVNLPLIEDGTLKTSGKLTAFLMIKCDYRVQSKSLRSRLAQVFAPTLEFSESLYQWKLFLERRSSGERMK